jgi:hypothetical protein
MREAVAIKIAEHLAKIAAPARVKRALDRYIEKKAIALTDRPMAYGAGLGALGGGALMGGSTAIANMFRKKEDKKSVLDNALLGAAGGGALGLSGGALYHGLYGDPTTKPDSAVIPKTPATPEEIKARLNNPKFTEDTTVRKQNAIKLRDDAMALPGSNDPAATDFNAEKAKAMAAANAANTTVNLDNETKDQRDALETARNPYEIAGRPVSTPSAAAALGGLGAAAGWRGGMNVDIKDSLVKALQEARNAGNKWSETPFGQRLKDITGVNASGDIGVSSSKLNTLLGHISGQGARNDLFNYAKLRNLFGLGNVEMDKNDYTTNWRPPTTLTPQEIKTNTELSTAADLAKLKAQALLRQVTATPASTKLQAKLQEALKLKLDAEAALTAHKAEMVARVTKINNMKNTFDPQELVDLAKTHRTSASRRTRAAGGAALGAVPLLYNHFFPSADQIELKTEAEKASKRTADQARAHEAFNFGR